MRVNYGTSLRGWCPAEVPIFFFSLISCPFRVLLSCRNIGFLLRVLHFVRLSSRACQSKERRQNMIHTKREREVQHVRNMIVLFCFFLHRLGVKFKIWKLTTCVSHRILSSLRAPRNPYTHSHINKPSGTHLTPPCAPRMRERLVWMPAQRGRDPHTNGGFTEPMSGPYVHACWIHLFAEAAVTGVPANKRVFFL